MDKLTELLSGLAAKLGTTVEHLWPKLVAYRLGTAIGTGLIEFIALSAGVITLTITLRTAKWDESDPKMGAECAGAIIGGILTLIGGIAFCSDLPRVLGTIMSPEGGTTAWLMEQIRWMR